MFLLNEKHKALMCVIGGFTIQLTLGNLYSYGNLMTYMTSYMHKYVDSNINYGNMVWVMALTTACQGLFMTFGSFMEKKLGPRITCLLGCFIFSSGIASTYYSVDISLLAVTITYGAIVGIGIALSYAIPMACAMMWFPDNKGFINGVIVAGFGLGSLGSTTFQTLYINPKNLTVGESGYFEDEGILSRVRGVFILMAIQMFCAQLFGVVLLNKPKGNQKSVHHEVELLLTENGDEDSMQITTNEELKTKDLQLGPKDIIYKREFYILWFIYLWNTIAIGYINSMYKSFGQTFISDDFFLSRVGSIASIFNCIGRLFWGRLMDKTSFCLSMRMLSMILSILFMTLPLVKYLHRYAFALWIWAIFSVFCGNFVIVPTATEKAFGSEHYTANYGLIFTSEVIAGPLVAGVNQLMLEEVGYTGCFSLIAIIVGLSGFMTIFMKNKL